MHFALNFGICPRICKSRNVNMGGRTHDQQMKKGKSYKNIPREYAGKQPIQPQRQKLMHESLPKITPGNGTCKQIPGKKVQNNE